MKCLGARSARTRGFSFRSLAPTPIPKLRTWCDFAPRLLSIAVKLAAPMRTSRSFLAADASWEAGNAALQTLGGFGFAAEYDIERKLRETRLYQVAPISTNLLLTYVAERCSRTAALVLMQPLADIAVVAVEQAVAGPFATRHLADLEARVIKVERPGAGDFARHYDGAVKGMSSHFVWLNRSKESMTVDVKTAAGKQVLGKLLDQLTARDRWREVDSPVGRLAALVPPADIERGAKDGGDSGCRGTNGQDPSRSRLSLGGHRAIPAQGCGMAVKKGWTGRVYEDFEVGDVYEHPLGRTVLPVDNSWFTLLTQNTNPIHFDHHYASQTEFKKPLVDSTSTFALVTGQSVTDVSQNVMANLGWDEVRLPTPVFDGDTIYSRSEVLETRESKSRPNVHRDGKDDRIQSKEDDRDRVQTHGHGL